MGEQAGTRQGAEPNRNNATLAHDLLLACGEAKSPRAFVEKLMAWFADSFDYDDAVALFYDPVGTIVAFSTLRTRKGWLEEFLTYYIDLPESLYFESLDDQYVLSEKPLLRVDIFDWTRFEDSSFKRNYIDASGLKSTFSFSLCDLNDVVRVVICLDRRKRRLRDSGELELIREALPILNSMYRNFLYKEAEGADATSPWEEYGLTTREAEIADMLCMGMKATRIGEELFIARTTARKHIAHIYEKVGVSSQAELIVRASEHRKLF